MNRLHIVSATRADEVTFWRHTKLGVSLRRLAHDLRLHVTVACHNRQRLPALYNQVLSSAADDVLVLVHDDLYVDDFHLAERLHDAMQRFDVVGVAGCRVVPERHVGWCFWEPVEGGPLEKISDEMLSGVVSHFHPTGEAVSAYGPTPQACALLDGCFLALNAAKVRERGVRFDERFDFHFYDLDFCRSCTEAGLRLGTWPIAVTHASGGSYGTAPWRQALRLYRDKWESKSSPIHVRRSDPP